MKVILCQSIRTSKNQSTRVIIDLISDEEEMPNLLSDDDASDDLPDLTDVAKFLSYGRSQSSTIKKTCISLINCN
jgi:hypothetical protein